MRPYRYAGGVAVLTGAAGGIGRALAGELAARGSHLALIDRDRRGLSEVRDELSGQHPALRLTTHVFDLSHTDRIPELADAVLHAHRRATLLINNAGVALGGEFSELDLEDFEWVQGINVRAPVALCKAFMPALRSELSAQIVNVSSLYGLLAPVGQSAYSASKFALRGFSEALRHELAPHGLGVTVVHPGGVRTNIANSARIGRGVRRTPEAQAAELRAMNAVLRLDPQVAARTILDAAQRRAPRVLVGTDARLLDLLVRALPGGHGPVLARLLPGRG